MATGKGESKMSVKRIYQAFEYYSSKGFYYTTTIVGYPIKAPDHWSWEDAISDFDFFNFSKR